MKRFLPILTALFIVTSTTMANHGIAFIFQDINLKNQTDNTPVKNNETFGDGVAAYSLGQFEKAKAIWVVLADKGHGEAAYRLALMMDRANDADRYIALKYYEQAMLAGFNQAILPWFKIKNGLKRNDDKNNKVRTETLKFALKNLRFLVAENNGLAMVELGLCLVNETCGVEADYDEALTLFKCALTLDLKSYDKNRVRQYVVMLENALKPEN